MVLSTSEGRMLDDAEPVTSKLHVLDLQFGLIDHAGHVRYSYVRCGSG